MSDQTFQRDSCAVMVWKSLLLIACVLCVLQYGLVLIFGTVLSSLVPYYGISESQGDFLYTCVNFGACAMSFIPGIFYDHFGPFISMLTGTCLGVLPLIMQLIWQDTFPSWLGNMNGLMLCYMLFGAASSFFNVIGCLTPLSAFSESSVGKVSAIVQVCLSFGISLQSSAFETIQSFGGDSFNSYLVYVLLFTGASGVFACSVLRSSNRADSKASKASHGIVDDDISAEPVRELASIWSIICSRDFCFMIVLFTTGIGFSFSFLGLEAKIAAAAGADIASLNLMFGPLNAFGRIAVSLPLDSTRHCRFGGPITYIVGALLVFMSGQLCIALPQQLGPTQLQIANALVAIGYGGMLGMVPPALRLLFGTQHLGLLYGILYGIVAIAQPAWSLLESTANTVCSGTACYRQYCAVGAAGIAVTVCLGITLIIVQDSRARPKLLILSAVLEP